MSAHPRTVYFPPEQVLTFSFLLPWFSGQQDVDTGGAELPTHWIFISPQITENWEPQRGHKTRTFSAAAPFFSCSVTFSSWSPSFLNHLWGFFFCVTRLFSLAVFSFLHFSLFVPVSPSFLSVLDESQFSGWLTHRCSRSVKEPVEPQWNLLSDVFVLMEQNENKRSHFISIICSAFLQLFYCSCKGPRDLSVIERQHSTLTHFLCADLWTFYGFVVS